jgi:hypothetical protein
MFKRMMIPAAYRHVNGAALESETDSVFNDDSDFIPKVVGSDRRTTRRFPIELPAELCIRQMRFRGTTVNIGSGGLLMKCSYGSIKVGMHVKVRITNWPSPGGNNSYVALIIQGVVVRNPTGYLAVQKTRYEFVGA